jgi:hypothetical protein
MRMKRGDERKKIRYSEK